MSEGKKLLSPAIIGLRELSEDDLETISEQMHFFVETAIETHFPLAPPDNYDIVIDVDYKNTKELLINIEIVDIRPKRARTTASLTEGEALVHEILQAAFKELEQWLKENYSQ